MTGMVDITRLSERGLREMAEGLAATAYSMRQRLGANEGRMAEIEKELVDLRKALAGVEAARELLAGEAGRRAVMEDGKK